MPPLCCAGGVSCVHVFQSLIVLTFPSVCRAGQPEVRFPEGLKTRVTELLSEWVSLQEDHPAEKAQAAFVAKLDKEGFLKVPLHTNAAGRT